MRKSDILERLEHIRRDHDMHPKTDKVISELMRDIKASMPAKIAVQASAINTVTINNDGAGSNGGGK